MVVNDPITGGDSTLEEETKLVPFRRGTSSTATPLTKQIEQAIVEEPVPLVSAVTPSAEPITKPAELGQSIIETPTIEPVIVEPKPTTVKINMADTTKKEPVIVEPIKEPTGPVETAQDIKAKETANDSAENALNEQNKIQATDEFTQMVESGASIEDMATFTNNNKQFRESFNSVLKSHFKNSANVKFFGKYSGMNNEQLQAQVDSGNIVPGSEQYNLLPEEQRNSFKQFQNVNESVNINDKTDFSASDKVTSLTDILTGLSTIFSSDLRTKYKEMLNTPQINKLTSDLANKKAEIEKFDIEMEDQSENIRKELAGNLPGVINAAVRDANRDSVKEKRLLLAEYKASLGEYQSLKDNAKQELDFIKYEDAQNKEQYMTALGLYEVRRKEVRADLSAEAKDKAELENAKFEAQNKKIAEDTKFERDIKLLEFKAELEDSKIKGEWVERDDGTYFEKSDGTRTKVLDAVVTPGLNSNVTFENGQAYSEVYDINNNGVGFTSLNTSLDGKERELLNAPNGTRIPTRLNKDQLSTNNPGGKECGEYVNDIVARSVGSKIGSTWNNKRAYANESSGGIGSVAVWQVDPNNKEMSKFGHAGIIVGESGDGKSWHIKSSNIKGQGIVSLVSVPKSVINGYKSTNVIGTEIVFNDRQKTLLDSIETKDLVKKDNKTALKEAGLTLNQALAYKSSNITGQKKEDYSSALSKIDAMMNAGEGDGFSDAIGLFSWARNTSDSGDITFDAGTDAADFKAQFESLISSLTLPNLDKMSGVLTDKDIELLKNASTALNLTMSESEFKKTVDELRGALNRAVKGIKIPEGEIIFTDDDGIKYSKDTLTTEITRVIDSKEATVEQVKQWIIDNNIKL